MVLPSLYNKDGALLLVEILRLWSNYKVMTKCLRGFFLYLDRQFASCYNNSLSLRDLSVYCFRDLICNELYEKFIDAAIRVVHEDRSQKLIDRNLLRSISEFFDEMEEEGKTYYYDGFENAVLTDATAYYSLLASDWLSSSASTDYLLKVHSCLNTEKVRGSTFLKQASVEKLVQVVHCQMIEQTAARLMEMQKAENLDQMAYQELLSRCADLSLGDGSFAMVSNLPEQS